MANAKKILMLSLVFTATLCVQQYYSDYKEAYNTKKGLTFQATVWP